jgi:hypothetical protein
VKILITGFTSRQVNSQKLRQDYLSVEAILPEVLKSLGHEVEHRKVVIGEDLSGFDLALIGICPLSKQAAYYAARAAYAFQEVKRVELYCGDWTIEETGRETKYLLNKWEKYERFARPVLKYSDYDIDLVKSLAQSLVTENLPLLGPFFPWGQHELILKELTNLRLLTFDPSPFCTFPEVNYAPKQKRWIYSALQKNPWIDKQRLTWPVVRYGNGATHLPENELLQEYGYSVGTLAAPYRTAGSGWWRARYAHAAHVGAIICCDPRDQAILGYPYRHSPQQVEAMSDEDLYATAVQQALWFQKSIATKEQSLEAIKTALEAAA